MLQPSAYYFYSEFFREKKNILNETNSEKKTFCKSGGYFYVTKIQCTKRETLITSKRYSFFKSIYLVTHLYEEKDELN